MRFLLAVAAAAVVSAGLSVLPTHADLRNAVTSPVASAHVVMTPPPDYFGSILVTR